MERKISRIITSFLFFIFLVINKARMRQEEEIDNSVLGMLRLRCFFRFHLFLNSFPLCCLNESSQTQILSGARQVTEVSEADLVK